ncbi:sodium:proton antiporter [Benzoatithermus flavus]|uniref:Sodium:proton antiporter n=1 Tax=Benzoatithermus flavus TaxID=3108223 RepID=A0ABU8XXZ5_9PROT
MRLERILAFSLAPIVVAAPAQAAEPGYHLDGAALGLGWVLPFAAVLLSIAVGPLAVPALWHRHYGKICAGWAACYLLPLAALHGFEAALYQVAHTVLLEYLPFIVLLLALFTVTGGLAVALDRPATPAFNTGLLATGTLLASWMGTTGAAMVLIRPLLRANAWRRRRAHVVVFFIFLVANIGGALTPLGDPPLFLGFLKGVPFFWPTRHLLLPTALTAGLVLAAFFVVDSFIYRKEPGPAPAARERSGEPHITGAVNILLLAGIVAVVLASGIWHPGVSLELFHAALPLEDLVRDLLLLAITLLSWLLTPVATRRANGFGWGPIVEVAKVFAAIFVTIAPAIAILRAGSRGALAAVVDLVTAPDGTPLNAMYFWATGILSSFLDNAPTYLVFFSMAGGDPAVLTDPLATTLAAISTGAVFMGANTYIGNAPNFMVRAIAEESGVRMPHFFGYMAWSGAVLIPIFLLVTWMFFR